MATVVYEGELLSHPEREKLWVQLSKNKIVWKTVKEPRNKVRLESTTEANSSGEPNITPSTSFAKPPKSQSITEGMAAVNNFPENEVKKSSAKRNSLQVGTSLQKPPIVHTLLLQDISGCEAARGPDKKDSTCFLRIYAYPYQKTLFVKELVRKRKELVLACNAHKSFAENLEEVTGWKVQVKNLLRPVQHKQLLVLVNPFGGAGRALEIFHFYAKSILAEAALQYTCIKTEYAGHARQIARELELDRWGGVVVVSGDGLVHEVLNGLMEHKQQHEALKTPIGVIPAGSGNAFAASLLFQAGYFLAHVQEIISLY